MNRTKLCTTILYMDNDCEFVSDKIFLDVLFYISEFRDQTKMINPIIVVIMNKALQHHPLHG